MGSRIPLYRKSIIAELAVAISSFNIGGVANLLSEDGKFAVQNENYEILITGKDEFLQWLNKCYSRFVYTDKFRNTLSFTIIQCLHRVTGNPIIVFEQGRFPVFSDEQAKNEQSGLVIISNEHKIIAIELCFLVMKTENPYIYEKRYLKPGI
jgi:hypothetical protein